MTDLEDVLQFPSTCYCGYVASTRDEAHTHLILNHPDAVAEVLHAD